MVTQEHKQAFETEGYTVVTGLFSPEETARLREHFMELRKSPTPMDCSGFELGSEDPLKKYPRMIHPHRWDELSFQWMTDPRLRDALTALLGEEPLAAQTMVYFKPPGARGQALHQDQKYLRARPGTCVAAWLALDPCDDENGCMQIVPGTQDLPLLCNVEADTSQSFVNQTVPLPPGTAPVPVYMEAGDVLFFNGSVIHGSFPNVSQDRFRRSLIGHYLTADAQEVSDFYRPIHRMDGTPLELAPAQGGGRCGVWVDQDGRPAIELREDVGLLPAEIH